MHGRSRDNVTSGSGNEGKARFRHRRQRFDRQKNTPPVIALQLHRTGEQAHRATQFALGIIDATGTGVSTYLSAFDNAHHAASRAFRADDTPCRLTGKRLAFAALRLANSSGGKLCQIVGKLNSWRSRRGSGGIPRACPLRRCATRKKALLRHLVDQVVRNFSIPAKEKPLLVTVKARLGKHLSFGHEPARNKQQIAADVLLLG